MSCPFAFNEGPFCVHTNLDPPSHGSLATWGGAPFGDHRNLAVSGADKCGKRGHSLDVSVAGTLDPRSKFEVAAREPCDMQAMWKGPNRMTDSMNSHSAMRCLVQTEPFEEGSSWMQLSDRPVSFVLPPTLPALPPINRRFRVSQPCLSLGFSLPIAPLDVYYSNRSPVTRPPPPPLSMLDTLSLTRAAPL